MAAHSTARRRGHDEAAVRRWLAGNGRTLRAGNGMGTRMGVGVDSRGRRRVRGVRSLIAGRATVAIATLATAMAVRGVLAQPAPGPSGPPEGAPGATGKTTGERKP